jgi:molybdopterin-guanine dinucleotide biosynthesis protein A
MSAASSGRDFTLGILSGGAGRRLGGADKGLLAVDGTPQVLRIHAAFGSSPAAVLVSANRHLERYRALGLVVVEDAVPGFQGPLAGVAALLAACRTPWLLSVPVDAVHLPPDVPARLFEALGNAPTTVGLARVRDGDGLQPTLALYRSSLAVVAAAALEAGVRSLQAWQAESGCVDVRIAGCLGNRNRPEDYRQ